VSQPDVAVTIEGAVAHVDLNRPDEGNALTRDMMFRLADLLRTLGADPAVNVIAIEARGATFCRGRDGRGESQAGMSAYDMRHKLYGAVLGVYEAAAAAAVPVVACVQGPAIGFGAALAVACDVTLASDAARFSFPEIEHGIPPTLAMSGVMRNVSPKALAYLIYSASDVDAHAAVSAGIASAVFPAASFQAETKTFLERLAGRPRLVLETIKRFQTKSADLTPDMAAEYAGTLMALMRTAKP
jgi:enoyl-CoA hydratase/carnithine racemase